MEKDETIAELRRRAEQAEAERDRLAAAFTAPQPAPSAAVASRRVYGGADRAAGSAFTLYGID